MMWQQPLACVMCVCSLVSASPAVAGQEGLLGWWKFDEGHGDVVVDSSGNENDGEIWDAEWVKGDFGTALLFDGRGAHVAIPQIAALDGSDEMTLQAWVYWEGTGRNANIVTGGTWSPGGFLFFVQDDRCTFRMGRAGFSASRDPDQWREVGASLVAPFTLGRWYHLAASFKRPVITTYVDGRQIGSVNWDYPVGYKNDLVIGRWSSDVGHKGLIDEVKIFNRALDADEIAETYRKESAGRAATPQAGKPYKRIPPESQLLSAVATFESEFAKLAVSSGGRVTVLLDKRTGENHILRTAPLISIKHGGKTYSRAVCSLQGGKLVFRFRQAATNDPQAGAPSVPAVVLDVAAKPGYFVFRVESVEGADLDEAEFVHLKLKPCRQVDAMSGLAADDRFGICLRTLNLQTRVQVGGNPPILTATAFKEHTLTAGGAALVACPTAQVRPVLQELVRDEGLPFSPLGGPFAQDAEENRGSYVFARVSEKNAAQWIELARRGGIRCVHLSGWQQSLGHYEPREDLFPNGREGLKAVVEKFHAAGLTVGIHTLTGCIGTNDPWVRPLPDPRLATDGTLTLATELSEQDTDILTAEPPGEYPTAWAYASRGNCLRIDNELIQYAAISNRAPTGFFTCRRGAFGTKAAVHEKGSPVHHMIARYGCFIPDETSTLVDEVAERIADVYNNCGLDQIYMDGAEAMRGWYGIARMRQAIFELLTRPAMVEASCWDHHSWPFHCRVGAWDHPKWGLKRFADDHLRAVEHYRRACLLEAQLGWWAILAPARDWDMETPDEIEYLSAKALGHDVPLSFQNVVVGADPPNARQEEYFTTIGRYERLRLANYFDESVKEALRQERQEFRLTQAQDGQWEFLPTDYIKHKVTGLDDGTSTWTVTNRFAAQPVKLRIQALYSAFPYDDQTSLLVADCSKEGEFSLAGAAPRVDCTTRPATDLSLTATNKGDSPVGAWARVVKLFRPAINLTPYDAIGLWVRGDGKGELLNLQFTNLPEYFRTLDDHYITVDFQGRRYFELFFRERDAAAYHDYQWPYGAHCVLHRSPLVRHAVDKLSVYLNNLPPKDEVTCSLGPIKALRTRKVVLHNPTIEINGKRLVFPVDLESGMTIELDAAAQSVPDCRVYDERGALVQWLRPQGELPTLAANDNTVAFMCEGTEGFRSRAEVTLIACGPPITGRKPEDQVDWSLLRHEYELPRTICAIDGHQNKLDVFCRPETNGADLQIELRVEAVGGTMAAYDAASAVTLEGFEEPDSPGQAPSRRSPGGAFVYDSHAVDLGCSAGVTQALALSTDTVKLGTTSGRYVATSTREDNTGWSYKSKRLGGAGPMDLSGFAGIGFWLHGDSGGQLFKLQLRDAAGGWQDMVTRVDFSGWRYCQFDLGGPNLKDLGKITAINLYFNAVPASKTVTCYVDEIRALGTLNPLRDPTFTVAGNPLRFPVAMNAGDKLVFKAMEDCTLYHESGAAERVTPEGSAPRLRPGRNALEFLLANPTPGEFRVVVLLEKTYP